MRYVSLGELIHFITGVSNLHRMQERKMNVQLIWRY